MLILYIDDDADDREIFTAAINTIDPAIEALDFESCSTALKYLFSTSKVPDYIFLDYNMPKFNGFECVQEIRSKPNLRAAQLVMYSTNFSPAVMDELNRHKIWMAIKQSDFDGIVESIQAIIGAGSVHR